MQMIIKRISIVLASFVIFMTSSVSADTLTGNPRQTFSSVEDEVIVKLPVERECWLISSGYSESLFGLSADQNGQYGIVFTHQGSKPVWEVEVSVGLWAGFAEKPNTSWDLVFHSRGTTNGKDYVYLANVAETQIE